MTLLQLDLSCHPFAHALAMQLQAETTRLFQNGIYPETLSLYGQLLHDKAELAYSQIAPQIMQKTDCKKGCSFCCYTKIEVTIPELKLIFDKIHQDFKRYQLNKLAQATHAAIAVMRKDPQKPRVEWQIPCPLLRSQICTIYEYRPIACRGYNSINVSDCEKGLGKVVNITSEAHQIYVYSASVQGSVAAFLNSGYTHNMIELIQGLSYAFQDPDFFQNWCDRDISLYSNGWVEP